MGNFIKTITSFANGEVSPSFFATDNIYGLAKLENMDVVAGGGLRRRDGLKKIAKITGNARLVPFSVSESEEYLLVIMNNRIRIFLNDTFVQELTAPWAYDDLKLLQYAQRFGTMIFVHPDYKPRVLSINSGTFQMRNFDFYEANGDINMPFMRYPDSEGITITATQTGDGVHFTTNENFWTEDCVGGYISIFNRTWLIETRVSATKVKVVCDGAYTLSPDPVSDWQESAFSPRRGWPCSITFYQNRLVFGGAKSWPAGVWISHVGEHGNFNLGTGLDDEGIFLTLVSGRREHICTVACGDNLQILTSNGEWAVFNKPLTPESIDVQMHTSIGCVSDCYLPLQKIEGNTIFVSHNKSEIRELRLDDFGETYSANNICVFAKHLIQNPVDMVYNKATKRLYVVLGDGKMAVLNQDSSQNISAWGQYTTDGKFRSVAVSGDDTYVVTSRESEYFLEKFSDSELVDCETYEYNICVRGLPLMTSGHNAKNIRIKKITARLWNSKTLYINGERAVFPNEVYAENAPGYTGDISVDVLGTAKDLIDAPWQISSSESLPLNVLSVTIYGRYQI